MTENCKFRRAILSAFYNISQRNFGILLILWCSSKLWCDFVYTCLDQNFSYKGKGPLLKDKNTSEKVSKSPFKRIERELNLQRTHVQKTTFYWRHNTRHQNTTNQTTSVVTGPLQVESPVESLKGLVTSRVISVSDRVESSQRLHSSRVSGFTRVKSSHWFKSGRVDSYYFLFP
jgi:hypothetical protein